MSEIPLSLREQLPADIIDILGTATKAITLGVEPKRVAVLEAALRVLEARIKSRREEFEVQVVKRRKAEEMVQELTIRMLQTRDEESRRIARELHDSAGQYLAAIQMNLSAVALDSSTPLTDFQKKRVSDSIDMVNRCVTEIRTISYLLHPPLLDEMGLASALAWYSEGFTERSGIQVELCIQKDFGRLSPEIETAMFRIVQQSLANIYRHSGSLVAKITIQQDAEEVTLRICDEGHGIGSSVLDEDPGTHLVGVGIVGMRERTRALKGKFRISSSGAGTTIEAIFPISDL